MSDLETLSSIDEILEIVTFQETDEGLFQLAGNYSPWILGFCPELPISDTVDLQQAFVFLNNFIDEARELFHTDTSKSLSSGPWSERDQNNRQCNLSATAVNLGTRLAIQIQHVPTEQQYHQRIFQKSREYSLNYERLLREKEQKETLIYAIVHDLAGPLTATSGIIEMLSNDQGAKLNRNKLYSMAFSHIENTHKMIRSVLDVFDEQQNEFDPDTPDSTQVPEILKIAQSVVEEFHPVFQQQAVELKLVSNIGIQDQKVVSQGEQLVRVLINLLDNALRYSPPHSQVTIALDDNDKQIVIKVSDEGAGVPQGLADSLFKRFVGGRKFGGKAGFGLYFCHMCVSKWGGCIEYVLPADKSSCDSSGACFKIALNKFPVVKLVSNRKKAFEAS